MKSRPLLRQTSELTMQSEPRSLDRCRAQLVSIAQPRSRDPNDAPLPTYDDLSPPPADASRGSAEPRGAFAFSRAPTSARSERPASFPRHLPFSFPVHHHLPPRSLSLALSRRCDNARAHSPRPPPAREPRVQHPAATPRRQRQCGREGAAAFSRGDEGQREVRGCCCRCCCRCCCYRYPSPLRAELDFIEPTAP
jgi:hypothetical protein